MQDTEIFEEILKQRGIDDPAAFFEPKYEDLHDPMMLPDMDKALKRLEKALSDNETIALYGDYDIDGLAAVAVLKDAFEKFGFKTVSYIPDRFTDGYGLSRNGLDDVKKQGASLVVTVDCGSSSEDDIAYAKEKGLDVIVTDHHEVPNPPKSAVAVVNAKRKDSKYPFSERSGGGIAFALVQAMQKAGFDGIDDGQEKWLLDLVALSTISDIVDLVDENRILAKFGLTVISKTKRPGIKALMEISEVDSTNVDEFSIGFRLGPRLNAAGRLTHAQLALEALTTTDETRAAVIAEELNQLNIERQNEQAKISREAIKEAAESNANVLVLSNKNWTHGINGIVASKLVERFGKPTFVMQELDDGTIKGSGRSLGEYNLAEALGSVSDLLISGGGHHFAAGATIKSEDLDKFIEGLNKSYKSQVKNVDKDYLKPNADIELSNISGLTIGLSDQLAQLRPFGQGNPEPKFEIKQARIQSVRLVGADKQHAQCVVEDKEGNQLNAIGFSKAEKISAVHDESVSVVGTLGRNDFRDQKKLQLILSYIELS